MVHQEATERFSGYWLVVLAFLVLASLAVSVLYAKVRLWILAIAVSIGLYLFYRLVVSIERIAERL